MPGLGVGVGVGGGLLAPILFGEHGVVVFMVQLLLPARSSVIANASAIWSWRAAF